MDKLKKSAKVQYDHFEAFNLLNEDKNSWNKICIENKTILEKKIGYALFDLPANNLNFNLTSEQDRIIKNVADKVMEMSTKEDDDLKFSCLFLTFPLNEHKQVPLFRINTNNSNMYLDSNCRQYNDWKDFKLSNTILDDVYCCPVNGNYRKSTDFFVHFYKTPKSKTQTEILKHTDRGCQVVSLVAGTAGIAAAFTAAPIVGPTAVIGAGMSGLYGIGRGAFRIKDKLSHGQEVTPGDCLELGCNVITAASMGVGAAALAVENFLVAKTAKVLSGFGGTAMIFHSKDSPVIETLIESCNLSKILFYFNSASLSEAIGIVKANFKLPDETSNELILVALADKNSITLAVEDGDIIKKKKYISNNVTNLVSGLLQGMNVELGKYSILKLKTLDGLIKNYIEYEYEIDYRMKIINLMKNLLLKLNSENENFQSELLSILSKIKTPNVYAKILLIGLIDGNDELLLCMHHLIWCSLRHIKNANRFYNSVEHQPVALYGLEVDCHPLEEVTFKIKALSKQMDSATDINDINMFIHQILDGVIKQAKQDWTIENYAKYIFQLSSNLFEEFENQLSNHKTHLNNIRDLNCYSLMDFFERHKMEENYGESLMLRILADLQKTTETNETTLSDITLVPAWGGFIDNLFFFHSSLSEDLWLSGILKSLHVGELINYDKIIMDNSHNENVMLIRPHVDAFQTTLIIITTKIKTGTFGILWRNKLNSTQ